MDSGNYEVHFGGNMSLRRLRFKPLTTTPVALFHLFLVISLGLLCVLILSGHLELLRTRPCDHLILVLYSQAALWLVTMIVDHYYKWRHKFVELNGYFYTFKTLSRNTNLVIGLISLCNAILIISFAIYFQLQEENWSICLDKRTWTPLNVFCILIMTESIVCSFLLIFYLVRVRKFNEEQPLTMFDSDDVRLLFPTTPDDIGYRYSGEEMVDLLDKYVNTINHLLTYNKELLKLIRESSD